METLEQFKAKQAQELAEFEAKLAKLEELGPIPGLEPYLVHGKLYGIQHIAFKLLDLPQFLAWAKENARDVYAVEGRYKGFHPTIPSTRDYADASIKATGKVVVTYSSIMNRHQVLVYHKDFRISFDAGHIFKNLAPLARWRSNHEMARADWSNPGGDVTRQYLRIGTDDRSADLETLLTWEQFDAHIRT